MRSIASLDILMKGLELLGGFWIEIAESNEVDGYIVFPHFVCQLHKSLLVLGDRRASEDDDALALGLVLTVLQGELREDSVLPTRQSPLSRQEHLHQRPVFPLLDEYYP